ncbi:MAG TPA: hypothetical protein VFF28_03880 [Candidatus Nanoarchaeia archaeon]|nr:hypothetical protein [Candidatus Nanoarchaeia archaeon]
MCRRAFKKEQAILLDICIPLAFEDGNFENRLFNYAMMHLIPNKRNITFLANRLDQVTEDRPTTNAEVKKYAEHPMEGTMGIRIQKEMLGNYLAIAEKLVEQANARQSLSPT